MTPVSDVLEEIRAHFLIATIAMKTSQAARRCLLAGINEFAVFLAILKY